MFGLQIKPEDCSLLGLEILKYMEDTGLSMRSMAKQVSITQPGLRVMILKGGTPTESSIIRLARAMSKHPTELFQLVYEEKIRAMAEPDAIDRLMTLLMDMFEALQKWAGQLPEQEKPSDYKLLDKALKTIKSLQN
ncbi:MAG: XRE family transcriptional regulator [Nostocaceae cyanobacterium]|nr:XRE family transcriptional regulator [Nostocaceae cyanobacterium]